MSVHVFGGTLSSYRSHYVLKRTSTDREDHFRKTGAEILQEFYVDDLLKSLNNKMEAIKLINNVQAMCASGGLS